MSDPSNELLERVTASVLEESAFLMLSRADAAEWSGSLLVAEVTFGGPGEGVVRLTSTMDLDAEAARNMLASDPDDPEGEPPPGTALGELTNIVAGVLVAELFGTKAICHLGIPVVRSVEHTASRAAASYAVTFVDDERRFVTVELAPKSQGERGGGTT